MLLTVPYHSQEDPDARSFANDCGAACASMILEWAGKGRIGVDSLSRQTTLATDDSGLTPLQVANLLAKYGLTANVQTRNVDVPAVASEINASRPVIALIHYGAITERQNQNDPYGHFVVVVGADDSSIYLNDPDFWGNKRQYGAGLKVSIAEFTNALKQSPIPNTAIFIGDTATPTTTATPLPHSVPPGPAHVNTDLINLRNGPAGGAVTTLKQFTDVIIQMDAPVSATLGGTPYVWVKVQTSDGSYGWVVEQYLTTGYAAQAQG
jgi:hypothetical protein